MSEARDVTILMATRNGAVHLQAQLDSIQAQTHRHWRLVVSDDGSTDATRAILSRFGSEYPDRLAAVRDGPCRGAAANFLSLLMSPEAGPGPVALADQDDVWFPSKLARALAHLGPDDDGIPTAYAARVVYADPDLRPLGPSPHWRRGPSFGNAMVENVTGGHTLVLSPSALALVRRAGLPETLPFHDWWIYLLLTGAGGRVILDPEPVLLYRQHDANRLGARRGVAARIERIRLMRTGIARQWIEANARALYSCRELLTPEAQAIVSGYLAAPPRPGPARARALLRLGLHRQAGLVGAGPAAAGFLGLL